MSVLRCRVGTEKGRTKRNTNDGVRNEGNCCAFWEEVVFDTRRCLSLFQDLAPDLEYEYRLLKMSLQLFDMGSYFDNCAEQDRDKSIRKAIRAMEGMLAEDAQKTIITSFVVAFDWDKELLADFFRRNRKKRR